MFDHIFVLFIEKRVGIAEVKDAVNLVIAAVDTLQLVNVSGSAFTTSLKQQINQIIAENDPQSAAFLLTKLKMVLNACGSFSYLLQFRQRSAYLNAVVDVAHEAFMIALECVLPKGDEIVDYRFAVEDRSMYHDYMKAFGILCSNAHNKKDLPRLDQPATEKMIVHYNVTAEVLKTPNAASDNVTLMLMTIACGLKICLESA
jgi:hypothetical protein